MFDLCCNKEGSDWWSLQISLLILYIPGTQAALMAGRERTKFIHVKPGGKYGSPGGITI